jgi:light-regulated signal transduction histidine kinase (bacteriophytochrome)
MTDANVPWFSTTMFMPHGMCFLWTPGVLWMHVIADVAIALAYFAIPFVLLYIRSRRRDLPFDWLVVCFGIFIIACGLTHLMDVWNIWHTEYWIEGVMKLITAIASVPTAIALWRAIPDILELPSQKQLRDANESLARANRELEQFTASVSHDLRSPLTTIAGQAGLLELSLDKTANEEQRRRLQRITTSVKQMSELIDALLVLSRISHHTLHRELIDVTAIVERLFADLQEKDPRRQVEFAIQPDMTVYGDRRLLTDMFANLVANAWKFTSKTSQARVEVGQTLQGDVATIHVRDNGAGFDMNYAQKLFKPFQRLHGVTEFEGSGVGLATAARIIDRHGGRIWAEGKPNAGAVFHFTIPAQPVTGMAMLDNGPMPTPA